MTREDFIADLDAAAVDQDARTATLIAHAIDEIEGLEDLLDRALAVIEHFALSEELRESLLGEQLERLTNLQDGLTLSSHADE